MLSHSVLAFFGEGALLTPEEPEAAGVSSSRCLFRLLEGEGAVGCTASGVGATAFDSFLLG